MRAHRTARVLAEHAQADGVDLGGGIIVQGDGPVAARLVVHLVRAMFDSEIAPRVRLEGETRLSLVSLLRDLDPWVMEHLLDGDADVADFAPRAGFLCGLASEPETITQAIDLSRRYPELRIFASTYRDHSSVSLLSMHGWFLCQRKPRPSRVTC